MGPAYSIDACSIKEGRHEMRYMSGDCQRNHKNIINEALWSTANEEIDNTYNVRKN